MNPHCQDVANNVARISQIVPVKGSPESIFV